MARRPAPPPSAPIVWPRADPQALAGFDGHSKICTMNCGPHTDDPRSWQERRLLCDDCLMSADAPTQGEMRGG